MAINGAQHVGLAAPALNSHWKLGSQQRPLQSLIRLTTSVRITRGLSHHGHLPSFLLKKEAYSCELAVVWFAYVSPYLADAAWRSWPYDRIFCALRNVPVMLPGVKRRVVSNPPPPPPRKIKF